VLFAAARSVANGTSRHLPRRIILVAIGVGADVGLCWGRKYRSRLTRLRHRPMHATPVGLRALMGGLECSNDEARINRSADGAIGGGTHRLFCELRLRNRGVSCRPANRNIRALSGQMFKSSFMAR